MTDKPKTSELFYSMATEVRDMYMLKYGGAGRSHTDIQSAIRDCMVASYMGIAKVFAERGD